LTVAFVAPSELSTARLEAYPEAIGFESDDEVRTAKSDVLEHMRALGYGEAFRVLSITRAGKGSKSLAIIVVQSPFATRVTLAVPDGTAVVYVQGSGGWEKNPREAGLLRRSISLMPAGGEDGSLGYFEIPNAQGVSLEGRIGVEPLAKPR
jgi:hypothetical protein